MSSKTGTPTPDQPSYEDLEREIRRLEGIVEAGGGEGSGGGELVNLAQAKTFQVVKIC